MTIRMSMTPMAEAMAQKKSSVESVKVQAQAEIAHLLETGLENPEDLFFHTFESSDQEYIIFPNKEGVLIVDSCSREEHDEKIKDGPFKGYGLSMPSGDTES